MNQPANTAHRPSEAISSPSIQIDSPQTNQPVTHPSVQSSESASSSKAVVQTTPARTPPLAGDHQHMTNPMMANPPDAASTEEPDLPI